MQTIRIAVTGVLTLLIFVGCKPEEQIVRHKVPKSRSGLEDLTLTSTTSANMPMSNPQPNQQGAQQANQEPTHRMVVGLFELDDATWFFKINGPIDQVDKTESQWKPFLESVTFDGGPKWELPEGWTKGKDRQMRFATLNIGETAPPLELAISSLGPKQDLLLNANRWRGQLGLANVTKDELNLKELKSTVEKSHLFDVKGRSAGGGMMPPFANRGLPGNGTGPTTPPMIEPKKANSNSLPANNLVAKKSKLEFDAPEGWEAGNTSGMVPVRLTKTDGEASAQITVIQLPAVNTWEPNVIRWAGQIGMKLSDEELTERTTKIEIDGLTGKLVKLISDETDITSATIAGMVKRDETAWFLKLTGDKKLVSDHAAEFETFMKSLKFPN